MDEFFRRTRARTSMAYSTMMRILHSAMNRAHEKVQSKEGVVERLSEQSKFCELAIMQLEACTTFVQEVADCGYFTLEMRSYDKLVSDFNEVRDRLYHRLGKTEEALAEKDRELGERAEIEARLRRELDERENQLQLLLRERGWRSDDGKEGFNDMKNYGEFEIPETENQVAANKNKDGEVHDNNDGDENKCCDEEEKVVVLDQMQIGSEIDIFKETLEVAFIMMQNAISVSEVKPVEMQWRSTVEKETLSILFTGFVRDLQIKYESLAASPTGTPDGRYLSIRKWTGLVSDLACMHSQLANLMSLVDHLIRTPRTTPRESPKARHGDGSPLSTEGGSNSSSPKMLGRNHEELTAETEDPKDEEDGSTSLVAKMIQTHESIIRQKRAEVSNAMKPLQSTRKDRDELKNRIQKVIESLTVIRRKWDDQLGSGESSLDEHLIDGAHEITKFGSDLTKMEKQDTDESSLHNLVAQDTMNFVLTCAVKDFQQYVLDQEVERSIREEVVTTMLESMTMELNNNLKHNEKIETSRVGDILGLEKNDTDEIRLQSLVAEDVMKLVLICTVQDSQQYAVDREVESCVRKAVFTTTLKCMVKEVNRTVHEQAKDWDDASKDFKTYNHLRGEIEKIVVHETLRSTENIHGLMRSKYQEQKEYVDRSSHETEDAVDLHLHLESLVKEEVYRAFCLNTLKEAHNRLTGFENLDTPKEERSCAGIINSPSGKNGSFVQKLDSLLQYMEEEAEEKMKEINLRMEGDRKQEDLDDMRGQLQMPEEEIDFSSIRDRFEKALQQLGSCKVLLEELNHDQANQVRDSDDVYEEVTCNQIDLIADDRQERKECPSCCLEATDICTGLFATRLGDISELGKKDTEETKLQSLVAEDVMKLVLICTVQDSQQYAVDREVESCVRKAVFTATLKCMVKEVNRTFQEQAKDWDDASKDYQTYNHLREEIEKIVVHETLRSTENIYGLMKSKYQEQKVYVDRSSDEPEDAADLILHRGSLVKEEVHRALFKDMTSANIESLIETEVHDTFCLETLKEAHNRLTGFESHLCEDTPKEERSCAGIINSPGGKNGSFVQKLNSLLQYMEEEAEEKMKEISLRMEGGREQVDLDDMREQLQMPEEEIDFNSIRDRFEKALQQLGSCKVLLEEMNHDQANQVSDSDDVYEEVTCSQIDLIADDRQERKECPSCCLEATDVFTALFANFEHEMHQKVDLNVLRLKNLKSQLKSMVPLVASLRKKEHLYKQAFIRRCENLQKAENEVDVLGDQVDGLLNLLGKVYNTLECYLPHLPQNSGVAKMLTLIKKELNRTAG